jgi:hypothetical protein
VRLKVPKKGCERHRWTQEEMVELKKLFKIPLRNLKTPGQKEIDKIMKQSKLKLWHIWQLKNANIKKKISYLIVQSWKNCALNA